MAIAFERCRACRSGASRPVATSTSAFARGRARRRRRPLGRRQIDARRAAAWHGARRPRGRVLVDGAPLDGTSAEPTAPLDRLGRSGRSALESVALRQPALWRSATLISNIGTVLETAARGDLKSSPPAFNRPRRRLAGLDVRRRRPTRSLRPGARPRDQAAWPFSTSLSAASIGSSRKRCLRARRDMARRDADLRDPRHRGDARSSGCSSSTTDASSRMGSPRSSRTTSFAIRGAPGSAAEGGEDRTSGPTPVAPMAPGEGRAGGGLLANGAFNWTCAPGLAWPVGASPRPSSSSRLPAGSWPAVVATVHDWSRRAAPAADSVDGGVERLSRALEFEAESATCSTPTSSGAADGRPGAAEVTADGEDSFLLSSVASGQTRCSCWAPTASVRGSRRHRAAWLRSHAGAADRNQRSTGLVGRSGRARPRGSLARGRLCSAHASAIGRRRAAGCCGRRPARRSGSTCVMPGCRDVCWFSSSPMRARPRVPARGG